MPTIIRAVQYDGYVLLTLLHGDGSESIFVLTADDPYGNAPALRAELERMVEAGEITIEQSEVPA